MEQKRLDFILGAAQPIAHHEETIGNSSLLMRRRVAMPDGSFARLPIVTGDTMRHGLREAAAWAYLDAAGMSDATLSEAALRLLFSGGMITGSSGGSIKLADYRTLCDIFPPLALLGGCAQNRIVPGRLVVEDAVLLCTESRHCLCEWAAAWVAESGYQISPQRAYVEEVQRVRMDPTLDPRKRSLLALDAGEAVQQRLIAGESAAESHDAATTERAKSSMMPRRLDRVCQGALFAWSISATVMSDLEWDTLLVMVSTFLHDARVGGRRGTGHGLLRPVAAQQATLRRPSERTDTLDVHDLTAGGVGDLFRAHVAERASAIRDFLGSVAA